MTRPLLPALALAAALLPWPLAAQTGAQTGGDAPAAAPAELDSVPQRYSYGLGLQIAQTLRQQGIDDGLDPAAFALGIRDFLDGTDPRLSLEEVQEAYVAMQAVLSEEAEKAAAAAQTAGEAFLAANTAEDGVETTDSGLQYRVIDTGPADGRMPTPEDQVRVHYEGKLLSGEVFDSSYERDQPAEFGVGQVIAGWQEVLQLMRPGDVWEVWIPSDLAYGERGAGADIGPNEVLNFKIELLEILEG